MLNRGFIGYFDKLITAGVALAYGVEFNLYIGLGLLIADLDGERSALADL